jgi:TRAP-type C4-dicarboxylate transport system permease small subunit
MAFTGIDAVVFGVADMAEARRFLDDWGTHPVSVADDRLVYETRDGGQVVVRPKDAPDLPPAIEPGNTVREVVWGAADESELRASLDRLQAGGALSDGPDGLPRASDPNGLSLAFRVSQRREVTATPTPVNAPGTPQRVDRRSPVHERADPIKIGHVVLFAADFAAMRAFYTDRMGFIISDEYPNHGAFMRCSVRGEHHNLFVLNRPGKPGVNHVAFTLADIHEVIGGGIAMSKVLEAPIAWIEQVSNILFIWITFLGAAVLYRQKLHIGVDMLLERLTGRVKAAMYWAIECGNLLFILVLFVYSTKLAVDVLPNTYGALDITPAWFYFSAPVSCAMMALYFVEKIVDPTKRAPQGSAGEF